VEPTGCSWSYMYDVSRETRAATMVGSVRHTEAASRSPSSPLQPPPWSPPHTLHYGWCGGDQEGCCKGRLGGLARAAPGHTCMLFPTRPGRQQWLGLLCGAGRQPAVPPAPPCCLSLGDLHVSHKGGVVVTRGGAAEGGWVDWPLLLPDRFCGDQGRCCRVQLVGPTCCSPGMCVIWDQRGYCCRLCVKGPAQQHPHIVGCIHCCVMAVKMERTPVHPWGGLHTTTCPLLWFPGAPLLVIWYACAPRRRVSSPGGGLEDTKRRGRGRRKAVRGWPGASGGGGG
jgi:hypothetical protein